MSKIYTLPHGPLDYKADPIDHTGVNTLGVHTKETTQRYIYGTRYITWDGKVYKYSKSGAACYTHRLNTFYNTISSDANGIDYSVFTNAQAIGDTEVTLTNGTTAVAEDYLAGGIIIIVPTETVTDGQVMTRTIIGNEVAAAAAECRMYLDAPLEMALTTSNYGYVMPSSYNNIQYESTSGNKSFAGLAGTYIAATGYNFWLQTYGACNMAQQTTYVGKVAYYRAVYARHDGTLDTQANTVESGGSVVTDQCVGFILDNNADANGATNIMLTISY
jgi:hypothetical protein